MGRRLWKSVGQGIQFLFSMFKAVFGSWQSPPWWQHLQNYWGPHFLRRQEQIKIWVSRNQSSVRKTGFSLIIVTLLSVAGYYWWSQQPQPQIVDFSIDTPRPTALKEKAPIHPLEVTFDASAAPLSEVGKVLQKGVSLKPTLDGTWKWVSDRKLIFEPLHDWPVDREFKVILEKSYFPSHLRLKSYEGSFHTEPFAVTSSRAEFYRHPEDPKEKRITATLRVNYPVDPESLQGQVKILLEGDKDVLGNIPTKYQAELTYDKFMGEIYVKSELVPIPLKDAKAVVIFEKGWKSSMGGNKIKEDFEVSTQVPGMLTYFKINSSSFDFVENSSYELEQVIAVQTSIDVTDKEFDSSFEILLLPLHKNEDDAKNLKRPSEWTLGEVTSDVLKQSEKVSVVRIASERSQTSLHTFKVSVPAERSLYLKVRKGLRSFHEYELGENYENVVQVNPFPSEIRILHEGSILSLSGDKKLSVLTRGVRAFQIQVAHVLPHQLNHLLSQSSGHFTRPEFFNSYSFDWDNITEKYSEVISVAETQGGKPEFAAVDAAAFINKSQKLGRGLLYVSLRPYDKEKKKPYGEKSSRFILVTDLGILAKKLPDHSHELFVQSVQTGQPVSGAIIEVIGKNGVTVVTATTNDQGRCNVASLKDFKNEKAPLAFVVKRGTDLSFLPMDRYDRKLQYSRFDVGGQRTGGQASQLQSYVFTDRGLYRPGEKINLAAITRSFDWKAPLLGIPVEWVITDPKGQEFYKEKFTLNTQGFSELSLTTQETSFVGTYTGAVYIIKDEERDSLLGSTTFRVEEFVADRMKISAGFSVTPTAGWTSPENMKGWVRLMNMFGFPAENRVINAKIQLSPALPYFAAYKDYHFHLPKTEKSYELELDQQNSNEKGEAEFSLDLSQFEKGSYRLRFEAEAFELEGGRSVVAQAGLMVSPYKFFVGYKTESDLNYLKLNTQHQVEMIAIDSNLKKTSVSDMELTLIERQWVSVLTQQSNGTFKYESVRKDKELKKEALSLSSKGYFYQIPTSSGGDFRVILRTKNNLEVALFDFSVVDQSNILGRIDRQAELQVKLEKSDYSEGQEIEMLIRAPYVGAGLITIEREKVFAAKWFKSTSNNSIQSIRVPAGLEGTAYLHVTFLRDIGSKEIFTSPLSYAVLPFSVDLKKRQLQVKLNAPSEVKPGETLKIEYSANKSGKIVLVAVDEGILQVAQYKTPDPLGTFFQKRALEIETSQLLDLILPEFKIVQQLSAAGGDADAALARNLNPFKRKNKAPAAFWSGVIDVSPQTQTIQYKVPDYFNGTLRLMAIAVTPEAVGVSKTETLVRGDFILTPTMPSVLTPGDEVVVGLSVFNNLKGSGANTKVKLQIKASEHLEILDGAEQELQISETKEIGTTLKIRARDHLGTARLELQVSAGRSQVVLTEEISLRPATTYRSQVWGGRLKKDKHTIDVVGSFYPELSKRQVSLSYLPLSLAHPLSDFLRDFPYGCTEQLVSKAFTTLLLGDKADFKFKPEQRQKAYKETLSLLRQRQTSNGGFGLYSAYESAAQFPSLHAIHYLLEAEQRGQILAKDMKQRVQAYLRSLTTESLQDLPQGRAIAMALYLLARSGQTVGNETTTLVKELSSQKLSDLWKKDIGAAFLAATYRLMRQDELAQKTIQSVEILEKALSSGQEYYDSYIHNAYLMFLLSKHFPDRAQKLADPSVESFIQMIQNNRFNTLNSSLAILALESLSQIPGSTAELAAQVHEIDSQKKRTSLALSQGLFPQAAFSPQALEIEIESSSSVPVYYQAYRAAFERLEGAKPIKDKLEILREYRRPGKKETTDTLAMGEELEVHLSLRSLDGATYKNVAVVDLLPSSFEVVLERDSQQSSLKNPLQQIFEKVVPRAYAQDEEYEDESYEESPEGGESVAIPRLALPGSNLMVDYEEPREDRLVLYAQVTGSLQTYIYRIRATNRGEFQVPPPFAEHMYDRTVQARGSGGRLKVQENQ